MRHDVAGNAEPLIPIGVLARRTRCNIETIRFYEKIGVLPPPRRTESGRRVYGQYLVQRLTFVRRTRELGFTLEDVRALLKLADARDVPCSEVKHMAIVHRDDIKAKIADLQTMQKVLDTLIGQCQAGDQPGCPLIETLFRQTKPV
ncbi:MerR family transcriptional regulator [Acidocella facilis]|uniref:MerR family transcriptional regulator n=1 Tax=Acidocella facilis TaxID=525 RepID=UPI001F1E4754|nr:helix-turn-helix domain-containing protein [Acidocella facilis]